MDITFSGWKQQDFLPTEYESGPRETFNEALLEFGFQG